MIFFELTLKMEGNANLKKHGLKYAFPSKHKKKVNTYCTLILSDTNPINSQCHISN